MTGTAGSNRLDRLSALVPVLFAVPIISGVAASVAGLVQAPALVAGAPSATDALALSVGQPIHGDPDLGYVGSIYTPLFAAAVGALQRVGFWEGWPYVVTLLGSLALAVAAARLAFAPRGARRGDRLVALAGAVGIGALAWWLVSTVHVNYLYVGQPDHPAWALGLIGLLLVPSATTSRRALFASVGLLSAALWTKQPAAAAAVAAVVWLALAVVAGRVAPRVAAAFTIALMVVNGVTLGVLTAVSSGWEPFYDLVISMRQHRAGVSLLEPLLAPCDCGLGSLAGLGREALLVTALPLAVAAALGLVAAFARPLRARTPRPARRIVAVVAAEPQASALGAFLLVGLPIAAYIRGKQGTTPNQFLGVAWALALLAAIAWGRARQRRGSGLAAAAVLLSLFALLQLMPATSEPPLDGPWRVTAVNRPPLRAVHRWLSVPAEYRRYARDHVVYHPFLPELNVRTHGVVHPPLINFADLLSGGGTPGHLVRSYLDRRFDAVALFSSLPAYRSSEAYASAFGRREENFLWKLDRVARSRYEAAPGAPAGLLVRRGGPEPARWMRRCFGPFRIAGMTLAIRRGGGFWCRSGDALTLRDTPANRSVVSSEGEVSVLGGSLRITGASGARFAVALDEGEGPPWTARGALGRDGRPLTLPLPRRKGVLRLEADRGEDLRFDLGRLRLAP